MVRSYLADIRPSARADPTTDIKFLQIRCLSEGISCIAQDIPSDTAPEGHKDFALDPPKGADTAAIPLETRFYWVRRRISVKSESVCVLHPSARLFGVGMVAGYGGRGICARRTT